MSKSLKTASNPNTKPTEKVATITEIGFSDLLYTNDVKVSIILTANTILLFSLRYRVSSSVLIAIGQKAPP